MTETKRRAFLVAIATALSGCAFSRTDDSDGSGGDGGTDGSSDGSDDTDGSDGSDGSDDSDGSDSEQQPSFELVKFEVPDEVEISQKAGFELAVKNTGNADGRFESDISYRTAGDTWRYMGEVSLFINPGDTESYLTEQVELFYVTEYEFRIDAFDEVKKVGAVPGIRVFGEEYVSPIDVEITVADIEMERTDDRTTAWIKIESTNRGDGDEELPGKGDFSAIVNDRKYDHVNLSSNRPEYQGEEVESGVRREGWIPFNIPSGTDDDDVSVRYRRELEGGLVEIFWIR